MESDKILDKISEGIQDKTPDETKEIQMKLEKVQSELKEIKNKLQMENPIFTNEVLDLLSQYVSTNITMSFTESYLEYLKRNNI